jgi:hypothetical protein
MERKRTENVAVYFKVITRDLFCNLYDVTLLCRWVRSGKGGYFKGIVKNYSNVVLCISYGRNVEYLMQSEKKSSIQFRYKRYICGRNEEMSTTTLQPAADPVLLCLFSGAFSK